MLAPMIVVTGPGRSGTSFVAGLYAGLGFDPGGGWDPATRGGLERLEVVRANMQLIRDLGMGAPGQRFGLMTHLDVPRAIRKAGRRFLPLSLRHRLRTIVKEPPWSSSRRFDLLDWSRFETVVERHGATLRELAGSVRVAKDPRFCWTLAVWCAAGAPIEHVLLCVRPLEAVVESRLQVGWLAERTAEAARNWFAYGLGLAQTALLDYSVPHATVRFPDFLEDPEGLYAAMRFPNPVDREAFLATFASSVRPELVGRRV
jgi:hypothetical protein